MAPWSPGAVQSTPLPVGEVTVSVCLSVPSADCQRLSESDPGRCGCRAVANYCLTYRSIRIDDFLASRLRNPQYVSSHDYLAQSSVSVASNSDELESSGALNFNSSCEFIDKYGKPCISDSRWFSVKISSETIRGWGCSKSSEALYKEQQYYWHYFDQSNVSLSTSPRIDVVQLVCCESVADGLNSMTTDKLKSLLNWEVIYIVINNNDGGLTQLPIILTN